MSKKSQNEGRSVLYYLTIAMIFVGFAIAACQTGVGF